MPADALPILPSVVARVVRLAADPECEIHALSSVIGSDPALAAEILRAANSPYYGLRRRLSSVDRAATFLGVRALRNLVLCLGIRGSTPHRVDYPLRPFWEASLRRASAARALARAIALPDPDELFALGLCQDLGVLSIAAGAEDHGARLSTFARQPLDERRRAEILVGAPHEEVGGSLFEEWGLPESFWAPIRHHHDPSQAEPVHQARARVAEAADHLADVLAVDDKNAALGSAIRRLEALGLGAGDVGPLLDRIGADVTEAAAMLQLEVGKQPSFQEIVAEASQGLFSLNLSYQALTDELQTSLKRQQELAGRLEQLNRELQRRALTDALTGLPNRRAFDEVFPSEIERSRRLGLPLAVLMLDADRFKRLNDELGHLAGDHALRELAQAIRQQVRACDFAARFGGEEFVVLLPHTSAEGALVAAERLRKAVEALDLVHNARRFQLTVSVGVALVQLGDGSRAPTLALRRADDALYQAKEAGRNRVALAP